MLVNILGITDDAKCYEMVRHLRWPDGTRCPLAIRPTWSSKGGTRPNRNGSGTSAGPAVVASTS
jgi:hypothetical protein